jgi:hypothetical protein
LFTGIFERFPSATATPYPSPVKGALIPDSYSTAFSNNLFSILSQNTISSTPKFFSGAPSRKRPREEDVDADIKLRLRRSDPHMSTDDDSDSDDELEIITCSIDNDKAFDRPIRPLRKSSFGPCALSALSALGAGSFNAVSGVGCITVPLAKDIPDKDEIMIMLD